MKDERLKAIKGEYQSWQDSGKAPAAIVVAFEDLVAEVERLGVEAEELRMTLTRISDNVGVWALEPTIVRIERSRWQFLGHLARKALKGEQP